MQNFRLMVEFPKAPLNAGRPKQLLYHVAAGTTPGRRVSLAVFCRKVDLSYGSMRQHLLLAGMTKVGYYQEEFHRIIVKMFKLRQRRLARVAASARVAGMPAPGSPCPLCGHGLPPVPHSAASQGGAVEFASETVMNADAMPDFGCVLPESGL